MWKPTSQGSPASETAALMVFVALLFSCEPMTYVAKATYDDLMTSTGLSRSLVARGIARLLELELITSQGSHQKRSYLIARTGTGADKDRYVKLPCRALLSSDKQRIKPFYELTLRSKHDLNALKLYLYFALIRSGRLPYSMASYEVIKDRTGVQERDIKRAVGVLLNCGLLQGVDREHSHSAEKKANEPNKYYLLGCNELVVVPGRALGTAPATATAVAAEAAA